MNDETRRMNWPRFALALLGASAGAALLVGFAWVISGDVVGTVATALCYAAILVIGTVGIIREERRHRRTHPDLDPPPTP